MICSGCGRPSREALVPVFDWKFCARCAKKSARVLESVVKGGPTSGTRAKHGERLREVEEIIRARGYVDAALLHEATGKTLRACTAYLTKKVYDGKLRRMQDQYVLPLQVPMDFGTEPALYFQRVFGSFSDAIVMLDVRTQRALAINQACLDALGRELEDALALDLSQVVLPEDLPSVQRGLDAALETGQSTWTARILDGRGQVLVEEAHAMVAWRGPDPLLLIRMVYSSPTRVIHDLFVRRSFSKREAVCETRVHEMSRGLSEN